MALIDDAVALAATAHADQTDSVIGGGGAPIIYHLMNVAIAVFTETQDEEMAVAAMLQRIIEDTTMTNADLQSAGYNAVIRGGISILTRGASESLRDYIVRIGNADSRAIRIKIISLREGINNLGLLQKIRTKYQTAQRHLIERLAVESI